MGCTHIKHLQVRKKSGMTPGSGGPQNGTKSGRVRKSPEKVRNGPGPLSDDRSDPRLCPMTKGKPKANANARGRPEKVRNRGPESPEEVRKSPGKSGRVRKSPEESGKVRKIADFPETLILKGRPQYIATIGYGTLSPFGYGTLATVRCHPWLRYIVSLGHGTLSPLATMQQYIAFGEPIPAPSRCTATRRALGPRG
eukprot:gene17722-biopygen6408